MDSQTTADQVPSPEQPETRYHSFKPVVGCKEEGEVIKLIDENETKKSCPPPLNKIATQYQRDFDAKGPQIENVERDKSIINDTTQIMNGALDFDFGIDESNENYLPFLNQPRVAYSSKSDRNFDKYLDWIVESSFKNFF